MNSTSAAPDGLKEAWQSMPWSSGLSKGAFEPPLGVDEIAGLATLPDVESLLIQTEGSGGETVYRIHHGPFDSSALSSLGERDWTLLVRDLDRHLPELRELWRHFDWLADYRRADIMVSIAAPGGSVGPHRDSYDVFLVQGHGTRQWQLAPGDGASEIRDHPLRLAYPAEFTHQIEATPGHTLYVPPGYIHHGVAQSLCTTWSFGLQAPLLSDIAAMAGIDIAHSEGERLRDRALPTRTRKGEIPQCAVDALPCNTDARARALDALGILLSTPKPGFEPDDGESDHEVRDLHPWTRLFWRREGDASTVYCNGQMYCNHTLSAELLEQLALVETLRRDDDSELFRWLRGCAAFA